MNYWILAYILLNRYFLHRLNQRVYFSYFLPYFLLFLLDTFQAQRTFMSPRLFNSGEASNVRQASANLSHIQFPPNCPRLSNPPRPYGYFHCYPRLRNFNPTVPPNITVGPTSVPRMLGSAMPDQLNMFLNYSGTHRDVTNQVGVISLSAFVADAMWSFANDQGHVGWILANVELAPILFPGPFSLT